MAAIPRAYHGCRSSGRSSDFLLRFLLPDIRNVEDISGYAENGIMEITAAGLFRTFT